MKTKEEIRKESHILRQILGKLPRSENRPQPPKIHGAKKTNR
jgi:hypothetical protein